MCSYLNHHCLPIISVTSGDGGRDVCSRESVQLYIHATCNLDVRFRFTARGKNSVEQIFNSPLSSLHRLTIQPFHAPAWRISNLNFSRSLTSENPLKPWHGTKVWVGGREMWQFETGDERRCTERNHHHFALLVPPADLIWQWRRHAESERRAGEALSSRVINALIINLKLLK